MLTLPDHILSVSAAVKGARLRRRARPIAIQAYIRKLNAHSCIILRLRHTLCSLRTQLLKSLQTI